MIPDVFFNWDTFAVHSWTGQRLDPWGCQAWWWLGLTLDILDNFAVCETAVRLHGRDGSKPAGQSVSPAHASNVTKIEGWSGTRESFWTTLTTLNLNLLYRLRLPRNCSFLTCRTQHFVNHSWQDPDQMFKFAVHWIEDPQWPDFRARRLQARMAQQSNSIRLWQWGHLPLLEARQLLTFIYIHFVYLFSYVYIFDFFW